MTENNKPEWFEITENDGPVKPIKARRSLPIAAVLAALLIIGVGAIFAQTQDELPANATETSSVANDQVMTSSTTPSASSQPAPQHSELANPRIATLPTGGEREGGEREGDDHEGRDHHGFRPPHHEDGEHQFEGDDD